MPLNLDSEKGWDWSCHYVGWVKEETLEMRSTPGNHEMKGELTGLHETLYNKAPHPQVRNQHLSMELVPGD